MKGTWEDHSADAKSTADKTLDTIDRAEMDRRERQLIDRPSSQANDKPYARKAYSQAKLAECPGMRMLTAMLNYRIASDKQQKVKAGALRWNPQAWRQG